MENDDFIVHFQEKIYLDFVDTAIYKRKSHRFVSITLSKSGMVLPIHKSLKDQYSIYYQKNDVRQ